MTCKDCVHYEACKEMFEAYKNDSEDWKKDFDDCDFGNCNLFKNKADFVEIPCRCKDCDHFNNYNPDRTYCEEHSDGWGDNIVYVDEDDYCSFGIRKKEGADNG